MIYSEEYLQELVWTKMLYRLREHEMDGVYEQIKSLDSENRHKFIKMYIQTWNCLFYGERKENIISFDRTALIPFEHLFPLPSACADGGEK